MWKRNTLIAVTTLLVASCALSNKYQIPQGYPAQLLSHELSLPESMRSRVMWEQQFYSLSSYFGDVQCAATDGILIAVGGLTSQEKVSIYAFDGVTGKVLWIYPYDGVVDISNHGLFVGDGSANIYLIHPKTGDIIWKTTLENANYVKALDYSDGYLFVNTEGYYHFFVLNSGGEVVSNHVNELDFQKTYKNSKFIPVLPFGTISSDDKYLKQNGDVLYSLSVYEKFNDELIWNTTTYAISNFVLFNEYVLWLSPDDELILADFATGIVIEKASIVPSINFFDNNSDKQHAGYYLCADDKESLVYLILGDSRQLFAVKFQE